MLKYILTLAPYVFNTGKKAPSKTLVEVMAVSFLFVLSGAALMAALFIWVSENYGTDIGFLTVGLVLFAAAFVLAKVSDHKLSEKSLPVKDVQADPIVSHLPDSVSKDPGVQKVLSQMSENPLAASAAALAIGVVISRELFGKR